MRIAFVTEHDPDNLNAWSGVSHGMLHGLRQAFERVETVSVPHYDALQGSLDARLRHVGGIASKHVRESDVDVAICQGASAIPYLDVSVPTVYWHDSTWAALYQGHFPETLDFATFRSRHPGFAQWDAAALGRASRVFFSSEWSVSHVQRDYGIPARKLRVVPFGANLEGAPSHVEAMSSAQSRSPDTCNLLFIGVEWRRKGLDRALRLVRRLRRLGKPTQLTVIGARPRALRVRLARGVTRLGFLDKTIPDERGRMIRALRGAHFLVHPARYEAFGCVLAEANAYAVPVIGTSTTGLLTVVTPGVNGDLYAPDEFVEKASQRILDLLDTPDAYQNLASSSYREYERRLNWPSAAQKIRESLEELVS